MIVVCPQPLVWDAIYKKLLEAKAQDESITSDPPVPLILGGWHFSSDYDKKSRWEQTVEWIQDNNLHRMVEEISDDDMHRVQVMSNDSSGGLPNPDEDMDCDEKN